MADVKMKCRCCGTLQEFEPAELSMTAWERKYVQCMNMWMEQTEDTAGTAFEQYFKDQSTDQMAVHVTEIVVHHMEELSDLREELQKLRHDHHYNLDSITQLKLDIAIMQGCIDSLRKEQ